MDVVGVAALVVAFLGGLVVSPVMAVVREQVRDYFFHPEIRAVDTVRTHQDGRTGQAGMVVTRLLLKNEGSVSAREVEAYVEEIFDNGEKRESFIPVLLRWTHSHVREGSRYMRDIHAKQSCYLDVAELGAAAVGYKVVLRPDWAAREYGAYSRLKEGRTELVIRLYNASGRTTTVRLQICVEPGERTGRVSEASIL